MLQLLDRARQDGISRDDERALTALITTAERAEGAVEVVIGTVSSGQGHETSFAQLVSEWLGVPIDSVAPAAVKPSARIRQFKDNKRVLMFIRQLAGNHPYTF